MLFFCSLNAQNDCEITLIDIRSRKPIENVTCYFKDVEIGQSNSEGKVNVPCQTKNIQISALDFETQTINTDSMPQRVYLIPNKPQKGQIKSVVIRLKQDEYAFEIVRKMNALFDKNHPTQLSSYSQKVYSKMWIDNKPLDTNTSDSVLMKKYEKFSSDTEMQKFNSENVFFHWERLFWHKFDKKYGEKTLILANRMSGIKEPIYDFIASLYAVNQLPKIFKDNKYKQFIYKLDDSVDNDQNKRYIISFYQQKKLQKNKTKVFGRLTIDAQTFGLLKYEYQNNQRKVKWINQKIKNSYYTDEANFSVPIGTANDYPIILYSKIKTNTFETPFEFSKNEFQGNEVEIDQNLSEKTSETLLNTYRTDSLSQRESNSYNTLDTIFKKDNTDRKIRLLLSLQKGALPIGKVNWNFSKLFNHNLHEGFRIASSFKTNSSFNKTISFGGYLAYGFGDQEFKGGLWNDILLNYRKNSVLTLGFRSDVRAFGRNFESSYNEYIYNPIHFFTQDYLQSQNAFVHFKTDIHRYIETDFALEIEKINTFSNTYFQKESFGYLKPKMELFWYPKTKFINTPEGKKRLDRKPTMLIFKNEYGLHLNSENSSFLSSELKFKTKINTPVEPIYLTTRIGKLFGNTPLFNLYEGFGLAPQKQGNLGFSFDEGFATLAPGRFYMDQYVAIFIEKPLIKKRISNFIRFEPTIKYASIWGSINQRNRWNENAQAPSSIYQEIGIDFNKLITIFGIGFYYNMSSITSNPFTDNFAVRVGINLK
jgi:hypothetical protein